MFVEGISVSDEHRLQDFNQRVRIDAEKNLPEIAKQFDAFFLQSMLKSNNIEQHFVNESTPFTNAYSATLPSLVGGQLINQTMPEQQIQSLELVDPLPDVNAAPKPETKASQTVDDFVKSIWPYAMQAASLIGLDPKLLVAQAALETGWGHFIAKDADGNSSNNLFNIKAPKDHSGQAVHTKTTEFIADAPVKMIASFKKYSSMADSFQDYIALIQENPRYKAALASSANSEQYAQALQEAGYATDPNYADKLLTIYNSDELQHALERQA